MGGCYLYHQLPDKRQQSGIIALLIIPSTQRTLKPYPLHTHPLLRLYRLWVISMGSGSGVENKVNTLF